jgi:hypothetical protein
MTAAVPSARYVKIEWVSVAMLYGITRKFLLAIDAAMALHFDVTGKVVWKFKSAT